jgi:Skp family chaperone for outer membrane proteins
VRAAGDLVVQKVEERDAAQLSVLDVLEQPAQCGQRELKFAEAQLQRRKREGGRAQKLLLQVKHARPVRLKALVEAVREGDDVRAARSACALTAVFAAVAGASLMRPAAPAVEPARLATVDLEKVFNSLDRYTAEQGKVKVVGEELEKQVKATEATVRQLQSDLDSFKDGSKEQADAIAKLQAAVGELRAVQQFVTAKLELEKAREIGRAHV